LAPIRTGENPPREDGTNLKGKKRLMASIFPREFASQRIHKSRQKRKGSLSESSTKNKRDATRKKEGEETQVKYLANTFEEQHQRSEEKKR